MHYGGSHIIPTRLNKFRQANLLAVIICVGCINMGAGGCCGITAGGCDTGRTWLTGCGIAGGGKLNCDCCNDGEVICGGLCTIVGIAGPGGRKITCDSCDTIKHVHKTLTHTVIDGIVSIMTRWHLSYRKHHWSLMRVLLYKKLVLYPWMTYAIRHSRRGGLMHKLRGHMMSKERGTSSTGSVDVTWCWLHVLLSYTCKTKHFTSWILCWLTKP